MTDRGDRAVSQVVAVALLVAIVTILSATVAVYATSFGDAAEEPPPNAILRTSFDDRTAANGQYLNITHDGGETIDVDTLRLNVDGAETNAGTSAEVKSGVIESQVGTEWKATETLSLNQTSFDPSDSYLLLEDATVRLVYEESQESSSILYECQVATPDCENREA